MTGIDGEIPDEALIDTLREVLAQAIGAVSLKPVARGAKVSLAGLERKDDLVPEGEWSAFGVSAEKLTASLAVTVWGSLSAPAPVAVAVQAPAAVNRGARRNRSECQGVRRSHRGPARYRPAARGALRPD